MGLFKREWEGVGCLVVTDDTRRKDLGARFRVWVRVGFERESVVKRH